jgi:hypothetical protein
MDQFSSEEKTFMRVLSDLGRVWFTFERVLLAMNMYVGK